MSLYFVVIVVLYRFCGVSVSLNVAPCFWSLPVLDVYILSGLSGMGCLIDISWNTGNGPFKWFFIILVVSSRASPILVSIFSIVCPYIDGGTQTSGLALMRVPIRFVTATLTGGAGVSSKVL